MFDVLFHQFVEMSATPGLFRCLKEGQMDFVGQAKAQDLYTIVLWVSGIIGFLVGFVSQRFLYGFFVVFAGLLISGLVTIPSWPIFNRNRLQFQNVSKND
jgi:signal peptidase complex subunit 1